MHTLYSDGGARGNPGPAAYGFVLMKDGALLDFDARYLGEATNNSAEYNGLIAGIKLAIKHKVEDITCYLDSELIVKQLNGEYRVKDKNLAVLYKEVVDMSSKFKTITFTHVAREFNAYADRLVNIVLDARDNS
jgi:ribonuclease HI